MATFNPSGLASFTSPSGTFAFAGLLSDGTGVVTRKGLMSGLAAVQKRGTILKLDPATAAVTVPALAADCNCILAEDVNIPGGEALVYVSGKFKADALIWPAALGHGVVSDALRNYSILVESVEFTDGTMVKAAPMQDEADEALRTIEVNKAAAALKDPLKADSLHPDVSKATDRTDSAWGYLSAEDREKHPEYANPLPDPTLQGHDPLIDQLPVRAPKHDPNAPVVHRAGETGHQPAQPEHHGEKGLPQHAPQHPHKETK